MSKHAYMIIAHNQFELLEILIKMLDDERNDIFVHIDAKVQNFDFEHFKNITKFSKVEFTDKRYSIKWASFDMVRAEYALLEKALESNNNYDYVHLISGVDLPIKSQDEIHSFFNENFGKEFLHFTSEKLNDTELDRVRAYHFAMGRRNYFNRLITKLESKSARLFGINRIKNLEIQKGSQWFSITGAFAKYILSQKDFVFKQFNHTFIPDEFFVHTLLINSKFKNNLFMPNCNNDHYACARLIDWNRGNPYVFRAEDYEEIISSKAMFARKFSFNEDKEIIYKIKDYVGESNE
ncbi:MAG: glycosyl transferase [Eubacterium sp.]|nr:glycosyl transferase [Eubacterium sp.]